jgi:hypothetical protein
LKTSSFRNTRTRKAKTIAKYILGNAKDYKTKLTIKKVPHSLSVFL